MKWHDDLMLANVDRRRGVLQMAMYAMHVGTGNSLLCKCVKVGTVKKYVYCVATFLALHHPKGWDFRRSGPGEQKFSAELDAVYTELQRWEKVPDRREPFTIQMLEALTEMVKNLPFLSLKPALRDWFLAGLFAALRLGEWAQESGSHDPSSPRKNIFGDPMAWCLNDIRAETFDRVQLVGAAILSVPVDSIAKMWPKWRTQKNGDNHEEKLFAQNPDGGYDFIHPMYNIIKRFVALRGPNDTTTPLALYSTSGVQGSKARSDVRLITSTEIEAVMREVAAIVYNLDPVKHKEALKRWSAHSLRVGACVLLHALGFTAEQIQFLLRWRSLAFMTYLRNTALLAITQAAAFDKVAAMPHFV